MIKMIFCLKRLPRLSRGEFQRYWREQHAPLVKRHAAALSVRRYAQSHTISDPRLEMVSMALGSAGLDFDGVAEPWWDSLESRWDASCNRCKSAKAWGAQ
jgi:uncharacterized protein (TIGR02118 family)